MKYRQLFFFILLSSLPTTAVAADWRPLKQVFTGAINGISVDPLDNIYVTTSGGLFMSVDSGQTWFSAQGNLPSPAMSALAADPTTPGKVFAVIDQGLYVTTNGGTTWAQSLGGVILDNIAIAPSNHNYMYVSTNGSYVRVSQDGGATWRVSSNGLSGGWSGPSVTTVMAVHPTNPSIAYTCTWRGLLFKTTNAGVSWSQISTSQLWAAGQIWIAPSNPAILYMSQESFAGPTLLRSADSGNTWTVVASPDGTNSYVGQVAISFTDTTGNTVYATTGLGVYKSTNSGVSWTRVFAPPGVTGMNSVAVDPTNGARVYAGSSSSGFYRSLDGGSTWAQQNTGIAAATVTDISLVPNAPAANTIVTGIQGVGVEKSTDSGNTWSPIEAGIGFENQSLGPVAVSPSNPKIILVSGSDTANHLWRSVDGGATFRDAATGYGLVSLRFDPWNSSRVHASIQDWQGGFLLSTDAGATWSVPQNSYIYPGNYVFHPAYSNVVFSVGNQYHSAATLTVNVLFSNDSGASWTLPGSFSFGEGRFSDLAVDQSNPSLLYVAGTISSEGTSGVYKFSVTYSGSKVTSVKRIPGVFNTGLTGTAVNRLLYDPAKGYLYAATQNGVFRSADQAATWTSINLGLPYLLAGPMAVTPDGSGLVVGTDGGIWAYSDSLSPSFQIAPASLNFTAGFGGPIPSPQTVSLSPSVSGLPFTLSSDSTWLTAAPIQGNMPATLQVFADPTNLAVGTYKGSITVTAPAASPTTSTVAVSLVVQAGTQPQISVDTKSVSVTAIQGAGSQVRQIGVSNTGGGSLSFAAASTTVSGGAWLTVAPSGGSLAVSSVSLTVTVTPGVLPAGTYTGTIAVTAAGSTVTIPVTLSVSAPSSMILVSQNALGFTAVAEGGVPLPQNFGLLNIGQGSMNWAASASTLSGGDWLQISPANGTVTRPYLDVSLVNVSIDPAALQAGTYYGKIQITSSAANSPQVLTVILTVLPAGLSLGPQIYPTGLIFTGVAGVTPGPLSVQVGNPTGQPNGFISGVIGTGFTYLPTSSVVQPNQPTTVQVYPDFSKLTAGTIQQGTITLQFADGTPRTISVLIVVAPTGVIPETAEPEREALLGKAGRSPGNALEPSAGSGCGSQALQLQFRSLQPNVQPNFVVVVGQAITLEVQVVDGCGNLVGPGGQSAQVAAYFSSGDTQVLMTHIGNGIWQGTWRPVNASGSVVMKVTALLPQGGNLVGGVSSALTGIVTVPAAAAGTPTVTAQGVVHAASDQGGVPIAPGGLITIYGVNLADGVGQSKALPLPQQLNGTQVFLGNQPLPILYTSTGQLNVQVPYMVPVNTQYQLTVQHGNTLSVPQSLVVAAGLPGIFTVNQQGTGQGAIMKSDGVTLAQPGTPAAIGETVVIYCTGLGAVSPAVREGLPAPSTPPLSTTVNTVTATIGGKAAQVAFSGLTPGYAGLYQVNAVVPSGITTGDTVPVVVSVAGQTSPPVTMAAK